MPKSEKKAQKIKGAPLKDLRVRKDVKGGGACPCTSMPNDPGGKQLRRM
jgi:hypothetical protein